MEKVFDEYGIYDFGDEEIVRQLCSRLREARKGCCFSQQELAEKSGVSIASIKRIESGTVSDPNLVTIIKLLRATGLLGGISQMIPEIPESPFLSDGTTGEGKKYCRKSYRRIEDGK